MSSVKSLIYYKKYLLVLLCIFTFAVESYAVDREYAYGQSFAAGVAFLNQGADIAADKGILAAVTSVSPNNITFFGAAIYGKSKYKTGSKDGYLDIGTTFSSKDDWLESVVSQITPLIIGVSFNIAPIKLTLGPFFEYGKTSYNGTNYLSEKHDGGNVNYTGGGLLGHIKFNDNFYCDFSGRIGSNKTKFVKNFGATTQISYDYGSPYVGCHLGSGFIFKLNRFLKLDTYGKYFFTRQFGKTVEFSSACSIEFDDANSQRMRFGTRLLSALSEHATVYCGTSWDYEMSGNIAIKSLDGKSFNGSLPSLKGGSVVGEIGASTSFKDFYFDASVQGYLGERKGFAVMIRVSFDLIGKLKRLAGYSLEKFYSEKTKKFDKTFNMSKNECFAKTLDVIEKLKSRITHKSFKKGYIVAFDFAKNFDSCCLDSTEVGVFITEAISDGTTNVTVEVRSDNNVLGKRFSIKLFEMLLEKPEDDSVRNEE